MLKLIGLLCLFAGVAGADDKTSLLIKGGEASRLYHAMTSPVKEGTQRIILETDRELIDYRRGVDYTCYYRRKTSEYQCAGYLAPELIESGWRIKDKRTGAIESVL